MAQANIATTIAILPDDREDRRTRLCMLPSGGLRLTHETYSPAVGWFAQGHVDLSSTQVGDLREALGVNQLGMQKPASRFQAGRDENAPALSIYRAG